jgi:hypothetical protein
MQSQGNKRGRAAVWARMLSGLLLILAALLVGPATPEAWAARQKLSVAKVYFEYNASANDLGVHVFLDGEDWISLAITDPDGTQIFEVAGEGPYEGLGLTELFFEGAEPSLDDVPLAELLFRFPQGKYRFAGTTVDGDPVAGTATLSHAIPAGPGVSAELGPNHHLVIRWDEVTGPPEGFPDQPVRIVAYQVIVGEFQVTVPATVFSVTVPPEFVASLTPGKQAFEVLAIEAGGNQTITEGSFRLH